MANLFPSIFPYAPDSPEMKKLGFQTEFEVYTKLGSIYDETVDILCEPKFIKRDYFGRMRDGEYTDFIILHPQKGLAFLECKGGLVTYNAKEGKWYQEDNLLRESPIKQAEGGRSTTKRSLSIADRIFKKRKVLTRTKAEAETQTEKQINEEYKKRAEKIEKLTGKKYQNTSLFYKTR